jgi:hypothetical protein
MLNYLFIFCLELNGASLDRYYQEKGWGMESKGPGSTLLNACLFQDPVHILSYDMLRRYERQLIRSEKTCSKNLNDFLNISIITLSHHFIAYERKNFVEQLTEAQWVSNL